ncbi:MAG: pantetheine-phosphate adenylyltransferase [Mycoplasmataceae bacterium]|nr:pantetheine-phosphate adenylyltransferase [Mycoplasmataceae bacterium]
MKIAVYPGSFNPLHKGHISVINKATKLFDLVYIVVTKNPDKTTNNFIDDNKKIIENYFKNNSKIIVIVNKNKLTGLLAKELKANFIVRSSRNNMDFEYEFDLANANNFINNDLETIMLFPDYDFKNVSSTILRHKKSMESN